MWELTEKEKNYSKTTVIINGLRSLLAMLDKYDLTSYSFTNKRAHSHSPNNWKREINFGITNLRFKYSQT